MLETKRALQECMWKKRNFSHFLWYSISVLYRKKGNARSLREVAVTFGFSRSTCRFGPRNLTSDFQIACTNFHSLCCY
ncbi:rCG52208 [Rattus norvegicus]|uniref:RCG52208 n=1 Tax=Rattus norvegicus TaxID=10116 RepID=A6K6E9_RAT|nr:rCG52208 [Rattus norvegicus]